MIISVHDASNDKKSITKLQWKPCPFCAGEHLGICATASYVALVCKETKNCGFEIYRSGNVETVNKLWNRRTRSQ